MRKIFVTVVLMMCLAVNARDHSSVRSFSELDQSASEFLNADSLADGSPEYGRILRYDEFERFENSLRLVQDERCKLDLNATLWSIVREDHWAVAMYDASAKAVDGIESGSVYQFGHFDQCIELNKRLAADEDHVPVRVKYCLADVNLDGLQIQNVASRKIHTRNSTLAHWGTCVPASCEATDVGIFLENYLQKSVVVDERMCHVEREFHITKAMMIYASIVMFFVTLALASTFYHMYEIYANGNETKKQSYSTIDIALRAFSIIENIKKLAQSSKDQLGLNAINGIKAIAMLLILGGHALSFIYSGPVYNGGFMAENIKQVQNGFLTNSLLFVDIFLFLSGFLFCRILLIELERRRGKVNVAFLYIGRYVRLTPSYMAVIGFYMTWFLFIGNGPLWANRIGLEQERCQESWWLNILYINNYVGTDKLCMFQSWYLSVDTQLFIAAPIVIFFLHKSRKYGFQFLVAVTLIAIAIPFAITYMDELDPTLLVYPDEVQDFASNPFYSGSYIKTHMRATDYVLGLLAGFIVHLMQERNTKIPKYIVRVLWVVSVIVGIASMFCVTVFYTKAFSVLESSLYSAFHKVGWGLSIGWLVVAVTTGHAAGLQRFLSSRVFAPISRLTYCAYLCNGIVELYHASEIRSPMHLSKLDLLNQTVMHSVDTFLMALVVCLLFESPIHALERILLRSQKKHPQPKRNSSTPSTSEEPIA